MAPLSIEGVFLPSRVLFGPHVTNLADPARPRSLAGDHVEHYRARAAGGAGIVVTETASVVPDDRPYEYAPLASACGPGWAAVAAACRPHGTLVLAGLGHAGSQSASRELLRSASAVPDPATRAVPSPLAVTELEDLVGAFADAAALAVAAGCDGVEIAAGQHALLRQFLSGLTNRRDDAYGVDRALLLVEVLTAVRDAVPGAWIGLRLGVDELAPWAGITPADGVATAVRVAGLVDHLVPVRGSALSVGATRPDAHTAPDVLVATTAAVRAAVRAAAGDQEHGRQPGKPSDLRGVPLGSGGSGEGHGAQPGEPSALRAVPLGCAVVLADGLVDPEQAQAALDDGVADLVEMTRAQLADPALVAHVRAGRAPRPCALTNQACRARDVRNPRVGCTVEPDVGAVSGTWLSGRPTSGKPLSCHEPVLVIGAGPAGLEAARTLALAGRAVRLADRAEVAGGLLRTIATLPGRERFARLADWLVAECVRLGVGFELGRALGVPDEGPVLVATGGADAPRPGLPLAAVIAGATLPDGPVVLDDPLGDGAAVALAERLAAAGREVALVTPDPVAGKQLARTGDLVDANGRLQRAGVRRVLEHRVVGVPTGRVEVADVDTGARTTLVGTLVDAGPRRPAPPPSRDDVLVVGDALAPRTVAEAIREGRAAAAALR